MVNHGPEEEIASDGRDSLNRINVPLIPGFFSIGKLENLGGVYDGISRELVEKMQRRYWKGPWGKPKPENKNNLKGHR